MAAREVETVDFFVAPYEGSQNTLRTWLVRRGSPTSTYVAVCTTRAEALARAMAMSRSQRRIGKNSVVQFQEALGGAWSIVSEPGGDERPANQSLEPLNR